MQVAYVDLNMDSGRNFWRCKPHLKLGVARNNYMMMRANFHR
jgi:hypothetical protein